MGIGAMEVTKPYKFIRFGAGEVTKPYIICRVWGPRLLANTLVKEEGWRTLGPLWASSVEGLWLRSEAVRQDGSVQNRLH